MGRILVGFDGSPPARRALDFATKRALSSGDELVVTTIIPPQVKGTSLASLSGIDLPPQLSRTVEENARVRLEELAQELAKAGAKVRVEVRAGATAGTFLALAAEIQASEIVIGHKAFEGANMTLGQNADEILRGAKVPVTVVP